MSFLASAFKSLTPTAPAADAPASDPKTDFAAFPYEARPYRITFKSGHSVEADGAVLARGEFRYDPEMIASVEPA